MTGGHSLSGQRLPGSNKLMDTPPRTENRGMAHTIFILGTNDQQSTELKAFLQERVSEKIVTATGENIPSVQKTDTVIITSEEKNTGVLYRRLLNKLEEQVHRAHFLGELIRTFSSAHQTEEIVEQVARRSTEVLGETAFVVLTNNREQFSLDAAYSKNADSLAKILIAAINLSPQGLPHDSLRDVLVGRKPRLIDNLPQLELPAEIRKLVDRYGFSSLIAAPIQTKEYVLGAFVTVATAPRMLTEEDINLAVEIADFAAIALENGSLFSELQRSATTDSLTGLYNTRFFNEVLNREVARAERYGSPMSLLMIDVDGFKFVNDTYGHVVGNKVLSQIGKAVQRSVRNTDFVFRCGGDEFGVVLPGTTVDGAMYTAEKILQKVDQGAILATLGYAGAVTVSIGVAEFRRSSPPETLLAEADQALYIAKREAKNCARTLPR
jgi:diguanylate cyclase (GGDEF)-like protein